MDSDSFSSVSYETKQDGERISCRRIGNIIRCVIEEGEFTGDVSWSIDLGDGLYVHFGSSKCDKTGVREMSFGPWEGPCDTSNPVKGLSAFVVMRRIKQFISTTSIRMYAFAGDKRLEKFYSKLGYNGAFKIN